MVVVHPRGRTIAADRVIALPQLRGPALAGLPQDGGAFIPVEEYGQVRGVERVWAAGDATDTPIKQGEWPPSWPIPRHRRSLSWPGPRSG